MSNKNDCTEENDPNYENNIMIPNRHRKTKSDIISPGLATLADKYKLSHRTLTEILAEAKKDQGEDLDDVNLSIMTAKRKRDTTRSELGKKFLD